MALNPFPNKPWFLHICSASLLKTLWEKENLLITSNFSFSHSVFYPFGELPTIFIKLEKVVLKTLSLEKFEICRLERVKAPVCVLIGVILISGSILDQSS